MEKKKKYKVSLYDVENIYSGRIRKWEFVRFMLEMAVWVWCLWLSMTFIIAGAHVEGDSMQPNFTPRELVLAMRGKEPDYGDVVLVDSEALGETIIKRVIGKQGDIIEIEDGQVYRNGEPLDEDYIVYRSSEDMEPYSIDEGEYFIMGDNRPHSTDSRYFGTVTKDEMTGPVFFHAGGESSRIYANRLE